MSHFLKCYVIHFFLETKILDYNIQFQHVVFLLELIDIHSIDTGHITRNNL